MTDETNQIEQIVTRAWEDEAFKQELLSDPKPAIEQATGEKLPEGLIVRVVQETPESRFLLLPSPSEVTPEMLEQLRQGEAGAFSLVIARSLEDEAFKQQLISDPNRVIEQELGISIPPSVQLQVLEQEPNLQYLVLPQQPDAEGELSEEELEAVAGGWWKIRLSNVSIGYCRR
jgi:hypothetical protein